MRIVSRHSVNYIGKRLYNFYKSKKYCDLWLQSSDGVDFMAHRCVCAASSLVIGSVISSVGKVSPQASILIPLNSIEAETLKHLIDFVYLGDLTIKESMVEKLHHAAQILEMGNLEDACREALDQLHAVRVQEEQEETDEKLTSLQTTFVDTSIVKYEDGGDPVVLTGEIDGQQFEIHSADIQNLEGEEEIIDGEHYQGAEMSMDQGHVEGEITDDVDNMAVEEPNQEVLDDIESQLLGKSMEERKNIKGPFFCTDCGFKFTSSTALAKHRLLHFTKSSQLQCTVCGKILFSKKAMEEHEAKHNGEEKAFQCEYCVKKFTTKAALTRHEMSHTDERAYQCQFCNKTFFDEAACEQHMDAHSGIKQFACTYCEFACNSKLVLYKHEAKHRGIDISSAKNVIPEEEGGVEGKFSCQDCNRSFSHYSSYWMHLRVHADDRRFPCRYCGKSFFTKQQTTVHERIHTGAKPYACSICGKSFSQPGRVKLHERIHTGEKPYACQHCGKSFAVKGNCDAHERIHTGEKRYECPFCGERFAVKQRMIQHQLVHGTPQILEMKEVEVDGSAVTEISIAMN